MVDIGFAREFLVLMLLTARALLARIPRHGPANITNFLVLRHCKVYLHPSSDLDLARSIDCFRGSRSIMYSNALLTLPEAIPIPKGIRLLPVHGQRNQLMKFRIEPLVLQNFPITRPRHA